MEVGVGAEFQDWEVLLLDSNAATAPTSAAFSGEKSIGGIEGESDSDGVIKFDYFSLDNQERRARTVPSEEEGSVESDNPSWIDPSSENRYGRVNSGELWSDSGSDRSDERKSIEFDSKIESGIAEFESLESHESKISATDSDLDLAFKEFDEIQSQSKGLSHLCSDSCGDNDQNGSKVVKLEEEGKENKNLQVEETKMSEDCGNKRKLIWWKVPFEMLKYCLFKASPVWSISIAAAVMSFIILGRKLYKMKRKSKSLHLKVILDEKKGSPFMVRAARLNEAFSIVKRVPIIRPALPAAGINPWPAMSMS